MRFAIGCIALVCLVGCESKERPVKTSSPPSPSVHLPERPPPGAWVEEVGWEPSPAVAGKPRVEVTVVEKGSSWKVHIPRGDEVTVKSLPREGEELLTIPLTEPPGHLRLLTSEDRALRFHYIYRPKEER